MWCVGSLAIPFAPAAREIGRRLFDVPRRFRETNNGKNRTASQLASGPVVVFFVFSSTQNRVDGRSRNRAKRLPRRGLFA